MSRLAIVDLFSGSGGASLGFSSCRLASFVPALAIDANRWAIGSYKANFPGATALKLTLDPSSGVSDAYAIYRKHVDRGFDGIVLLASPPCESFSNGATNLRQRDDERNYLLRLVLRWTAAMRPLAAVVENVPQMRRLHGGAFHDELVEGLEGLGYRVACGEMSAADYGVPQRRTRLIYVAVRAEFERSPEVPPPTHGRAKTQLPYVTVRDAVGDLPVREAGKGPDPFISGSNPDNDHRIGYYAAAMRPPIGTSVFHHVSRPLGEVNRKRLRALAPGEAMENLPRHLRPKKGFPGSYGRLHPDETAFTITAHFGNPGSGRFFHYSQERIITLREGARLQGFPDTHRWSGYYEHIAEQIGDAVPPPLAHAIAHDLAQVLIQSGAIDPPDSAGDGHCVFADLKVPETQNAPAEPAQSVVRTTVA